VNKLAGIILTALLLVGSVLAIHNYQVYDNNIDSYTGQIARDRRIYDPYTRDRYFGQDYQRDFTNFGSKGPTDRLELTGRKSAFSSVFNLDTNSLSNQGRDPAHISNWDPRVRGFARMDRSVELLPYSPVDQIIGPTATFSKGTARLYSTGNAYGATLNHPWPRTQIFIQAINMPPLGEEEIYEAWLFDDEAEYALNLGIMKSSNDLSIQAFLEIPRLTHMFDHVLISREPYPDYDPTLGKIVLAGNVNPSRTEVITPPSYFPRLR